MWRLKRASQLAAQAQPHHQASLRTHAAAAESIHAYSAAAMSGAALPAARAASPFYSAAKGAASTSISSSSLLSPLRLLSSPLRPLHSSSVRRSDEDDQAAKIAAHRERMRKAREAAAAAPPPPPRDEAAEAAAAAEELAAIKRKAAEAAAVEAELAAQKKADPVPFVPYVPPTFWQKFFRIYTDRTPGYEILQFRSLKEEWKELWRFREVMQQRKQQMQAANAAAKLAEEEEARGGPPPPPVTSAKEAALQHMPDPERRRPIPRPSTVKMDDWTADPKEMARRAAAAEDAKKSEAEFIARAVRKKQIKDYHAAKVAEAAAAGLPLPTDEESAAAYNLANPEVVASDDAKEEEDPLDYKGSKELVSLQHQVPLNLRRAIYIREEIANPHRRLWRHVKGPLMAAFVPILRWALKLGENGGRHDPNELWELEEIAMLNWIEEEQAEARAAWENENAKLVAQGLQPLPEPEGGFGPRARTYEEMMAEMDEEFEQQEAEEAAMKAEEEAKLAAEEAAARKAAEEAGEEYVPKEKPKEEAEEEEDEEGEGKQSNLDEDGNLEWRPDPDFLGELDPYDDYADIDAAGLAQKISDAVKLSRELGEDEEEAKKRRIRLTLRERYALMKYYEDLDVEGRPARLDGPQLPLAMEFAHVPHHRWPWNWPDPHGKNTQSIPPPFVPGQTLPPNKRDVDNAFHYLMRTPMSGSYRDMAVTWMESIAWCRELKGMGWEENPSARVKATRKVSDFVKRESDVAQALGEIMMADPTFTETNFIEEMREIMIPEIITAFRVGDMKLLHTVVEGDASRQMFAAFRERAMTGEVLDPRILDIRGLDIVKAGLEEDVAFIHITFICQHVASAAPAVPVEAEEEGAEAEEGEKEAGAGAEGDKAEGAKAGAAAPGAKPAAGAPGAKPAGAAGATGAAASSDPAAAAAAAAAADAAAADAAAKAAATKAAPTQVANVYYSWMLRRDYESNTYNWKIFSFQHQHIASLGV